MPAYPNSKANFVVNAYLAGFDQLVDIEPEDVHNVYSGLRREMIRITQVTEKKLKLAVYAARIYNMIGRDVNENSLSASRLSYFDTYQKVLEQHVDAGEIPEVNKNNPIYKALNAVPTYLRNKLGVQKIALSYVIRQDPGRALGALANRLPHSSDYPSLADELIDYTPHIGAGWQEDNRAVYDIINEIVKDTPQTASIKAFARTGNSRSA